MSNSQQEIQRLVLEYLDANERKNKAASDEKRALKALQSVVLEKQTLDISGNKFSKVEVGEFEEVVDEIDVAAVFKKYPQHILQVVTVGKAKLEELIGSANVAKLTKSVTKPPSFKVRKIT